MKIRLLILLSLAICLFALSFLIACSEEGDDDDDDSGGKGDACQTTGEALNDCIKDCGLVYDCMDGCYNEYFDTLMTQCGAEDCGEGCWDTYETCFDGYDNDDCKGQCISTFGECVTVCLGE